MGWLYSFSTRQEMIDDLTRPSSWGREGAEARRTCLASTYKGSPWAGVLYAVLRVDRQEDGEWVEGDPFILVAMLRHSNYGGNKMWGYKDMDESMHPYYYGCPLKYFDLVPQVSCQEWRDQTRARWKEIAAKTERTKAARKAARARRMN